MPRSVHQAMAVAMAVAGAVGYAFERLIVRPVYGQHLKQILITMGGMIVAVSWTLAKAVTWGWPQALILALSLAGLAAKVAVYWIVLGAALLSALIC